LARGGLDAREDVVTDAQVTIRSRSHGDRVVSVVWERGGLAVHETLRLNSNARVIWSVTHMASGMALVRAARSQAAAITIAEELLPLTDWQQSALSLRTESGLGGRVKALLRSHS
jgi:hypothetical protein